VATARLVHNAGVAFDAHAARLVDIIDAERHALAAQVIAHLQAELPSYAALPADSLVTQLAIGVQFVADTLRSEGRDSSTMLAAMAELGRIRAREGVDPADLIRAIRITARAALDFAQTRAADAEIDAAATFELATALWDWVEAIVAELSPANASDEERRGRDVAARRFVKACVNGEASPDEILAAAAACGADASLSYHVVRAIAHDRSTESLVRDVLTPPAGRPGVVTTLDDEVVALLATRPVRPASFPAGVGPAVPAASGRVSYLAAGRVLRTAELLGRTGLLQLSDVGMHAAVIHDTALGQALADRYLPPLTALGDFGDQLFASIRVYFSCGQSVEDAARMLFVHPNTLRHRLARFEEATGANLRSPQDVAEIWWLLARAGLDEQRG
jgi:hypothetical protein